MSTQRLEYLISVTVWRNHWPKTLSRPTCLKRRRRASPSLLRRYAIFLERQFLLLATSTKLRLLSNPATLNTVSRTSLMAWQSLFFKRTKPSYFKEKQTRLGLPRRFANSSATASRRRSADRKTTRRQVSK